MVELIIDGRGAECDPRREVKIPLRAPGGWDETGREVRVSLPINRRSTIALGDAAQALAREKFNSVEHRGRIERDGCVLMSGRVSLRSVERGADGGGWYNMLLTEPRHGWAAEAGQRMFREIPVEFGCVLGTGSLIESWTWDRPVRFLPVQRRAEMVGNGSGAIVSPAAVLSWQDYHPFLHVATLLRAIIEGAGYTLVSRLVASGAFGELYMSGCYPEQETSALRAALDFRAGRFADAATTVDTNGNVRCSPYSTLSSVGNIVESAEPTEARDGQTIAGVYNLGGAFRKEGARVAFVPRGEVGVGFEFHIAYRTDYRVLSRGELDGVHGVILPDGTEHSFRLVNRFEDMRGGFVAGTNYMFVAFDHAEGTSYALRYESRSSPGGEWRTISLTPFSSRTRSITIAEGAGARNMTLLSRASGASEYTAHGGDWALYEGWVTERGTVDVEVVLRSAPVAASPSAPVYFDDVVFRSGVPGAGFTLLKATWLRPLFSANPSPGDSVTFAEVAAHRIRQSEFVEALAHMFNLRFFTDEHTRQVFVEPWGEFFDQEPVDWSRLCEPERGIEIVEPGEELGRLTTLCYQPGDGAVREWEAQNSEDFARESFRVSNLMASSREREVQNPLFAPTLSLRGGYPDAPDAWLMQAGERGEYGRQEADSLNFPAKIVRYRGMRTLPPGQTWGWPSYAGSYPLAAFHLPGAEGFTLCFEDRDGVAGLRTLHEPLYRAIERGRRITAWLRLGAAHVEALGNPSQAGGGMRRKFVIDAEGERIACLLEALEDYRPLGDQAVECTFLTI